MCKYNLVFDTKISYEWDLLIWNPGAESLLQSNEVYPQVEMNYLKALNTDIY